jgi:hypothetical protein
MRAVFVTAPILAQPNAQLGRLLTITRTTVSLCTPQTLSEQKSRTKPQAAPPWFGKRFFCFE